MFDIKIFPVLLCSIVVLIHINFGDALICYECTRYDGRGCGDSFNKTTVRAVNCTNSTFIIGNYDGMRYQCVSYSTVDRYNSSNTIRACTVRTDENYCKVKKAEVSHYGQTLQFCNTCYDDYCNAAHSFQLGHVLLVIILSCTQIYNFIQ